MNYIKNSLLFYYDHCVNINIFIQSCILLLYSCNIFYVNIQLMAGSSIWPIFVDKTNYYCHIDE